MHKTKIICINELSRILNNYLGLKETAGCLITRATIGTSYQQLNPDIYSLGPGGQLTIEIEWNEKE